MERTGFLRILIRSVACEREEGLMAKSTGGVQGKIRSLVEKNPDEWRRRAGDSMYLAAAAVGMMGIVALAPNLEAAIVSLGGFVGVEAAKMLLKDFWKEWRAGKQVPHVEEKSRLTEVLQQNPHAFDDLLKQTQAEALLAAVLDLKQELVARGEEHADIKDILLRDREEQQARGEEHGEILERLDERLSPPVVAVPFQAPPPEVLVGRDEELDKLRERLLGGETVGIVGLHGMGGIGKTALAARLAHDLRDDFPDGVVWCEVGDRAPLVVLSDIASAYGLRVDPKSDLPGRAALVRSVLGDKHALLVLDDVKKVSVKYLKHLLPSPPCACVVTSRLEHMSGVPSETLDLLEEGQGLDLLRGIVGAKRVDAEPEEAKRIYELTGGLPLALRIVARRLAVREAWTLEHFAERLESTRLRELEPGKEKDLNVRASLRVSYDELDEEDKRRYRALGVFETGFGVGAATAVSGLMDAGQDVLAWMEVLQSEAASPEDEARQARAREALDACRRERLDQSRAMLEGFCGLSLLTSVSQERHKLHDLLREFAREELCAAGEEEAVRARQVGYFLGTCGSTKRTTMRWRSSGATLRTSSSGWTGRERPTIGRR